MIIAIVGADAEAIEWRQPRRTAIHTLVAGESANTLRVGHWVLLVHDGCLAWAQVRDGGCIRRMRNLEALGTGGGAP